jgi:hypothetical protein
MYIETGCGCSGFLELQNIKPTYLFEDWLFKNNGLIELRPTFLLQKILSRRSNFGPGLIPLLFGTNISGA